MSIGNNNIVKMPQLQGTEKQIKWAEDIRKQSIEDLEYLNPDSKGFRQMVAVDSRGKLKNRGYSEYMPDMQKRDVTEALEKLKQMYTDALKKMANITDAEWFIRRRHVNILDLFPDKSRDENGLLIKK